MYRKIRNQRRRPGFALGLIVIALIVLLVTGVGLLSVGMRRREFGIKNTSGIAARCSADAGLTKALFEMNEKLKVKPWDDSSLPQATNISLPNCDAVFSYKVTGDLGSGYKIQSTGNSDQAQRTVTCTLQLQGPFESAIFTKQYIYMKRPE